MTSLPIGTTAPLPEAKHWRAVFSAAPQDGTALAKPWLRDGDRHFWFSRGAWALRAIVDAKRATASKTPSLWLPDYFCNQTIWPLRRSNVHLVFYPVDDGLRPAWNDCALLAKNQPPDLFLLVHYFGYPVETREARAFCDAHGATFIEDAAHLLMPTGDVGKAADFVVYSQYKHLPMPDGGLLIVRPSSSALAREVEASSRHLARSAPPAAFWLLKRLLQSALPTAAAGAVRRRNRNFDEDPPVLPLPETAAISASARRFLAASIEHLGEIAARRRTNDAALRNLFSHTGIMRALFPPPGENDIPYRAVFRAKNQAAAQIWYDRIVRTGNVVESWADLPPEVTANPLRHTTAIALRQTVLSLPINVDREPSDLTENYGLAVSAA